MVGKFNFVSTMPHDTRSMPGGGARCPHRSLSNHVTASPMRTSGSAWKWRLTAAAICALAPLSTAQPVVLDVSGFREQSGTTLTHDATSLRLTWPVSANEQGHVVLNLESNKPLFELLGIGRNGQPPTRLMQRVDPMTVLTIGERDLKNPSGWVAFFDNPPQRAYRTVPAVLLKRNARVTNAGSRTTLRIGDVTAGSFRGAIELTVVRNSPLVFVETVVQ